MKKGLYFLLLMVGTAIFVQAQVIYSCNFETAASRAGWRDYTWQEWSDFIIGTSISRSGMYSLHTKCSQTSNDFGSVPSRWSYTKYTAWSSDSIALDTGCYVLSFDCYVNSATTKDSLSLALVYKGTPTDSYSTNPDAWFFPSGAQNIRTTGGWIRVMAPFVLRNPTTNKYEIRIKWHQSTNTSRSCAGYGAAVDNIVLEKVPAVPCILNLTSNNEQYGTAKGGGWYISGDTANLTAAPQGGYAFMGWSDSVMTNPRRLVMWSDTAIQAVFNAVDVVGHTVDDTIWHNDTVSVYDTTLVTLYDTTQVAIYDTTLVTLYDTTQVTLYDTTHVTLYDTTAVTVYVIDTIHVTDTSWVYDTTAVTVYVIDTIHVTDTSWVYDTTFVTVYDTTSVTVYDTIHVTVYDTVRVEIDPVAEVPWRIRAVEGGIAVEGAAGETITVYDLAGRRLYRRRHSPSEVHFPLPAAGVYLVQIGTASARRVVLK